MFFCEQCNFSSKYRRDFNRHLSTQKHYKNTENQKKTLSTKKPKMSKMEPTFPNFTHEKVQKCPKKPQKPQLLPKGNSTHKNSKTQKKMNTYICNGCGKIYSRNSNLLRHQKIKSCGIFLNNDVKKNTKNTLLSQINRLSSQLKEQNKILETKEEHFRGILEEKERCIQILREQNKHITTSHFQIIQNNIIDMNAVKFLNAYCSNNPTLDEITTRVHETTLNHADTQLLKTAFEFGNLNIIGDTINRILKDKNKEIIEERGIGIGTCENVIFCNDGSGRKYIAKGEPGWTYFCSDEPLDKAIRDVVKQSDEEDNKLYLNTKDRIAILKKVKKDNDWNDSKQKVIDNIIGKQAISQSFTIQPIETKSSNITSTSSSIIVPIEDNKDV